MACHEERAPGYAEAPCGGKTQEQALSFQGEPFLVDKNAGFLFLTEMDSVQKAVRHFAALKPIPEPPPPKA